MEEDDGVFLMKFKVGEVWRTRDGRKVKIIYNYLKLSRFPIVGIIEQGDGCEATITAFTKDGALLTASITNSDLIDLWNEPEEIEVFEWMIKRAYWVVTQALMTEEEAAKEFPHNERRKTGRSWKVPK